MCQYSRRPLTIIYHRKMCIIYENTYVSYKLLNTKCIFKNPIVPFTVLFTNYKAKASATKQLLT